LVSPASPTATEVWQLSRETEGRRCFIDDDDGADADAAADTDADATAADADADADDENDVDNICAAACSV
jgi:hypothetical protein